MRLTRLLLATMLLALATLPLRAQTPSSPYMVTLPVQDTSAAQRDQAFAEALGQVLERVAGGQDLRANPGYDDALKGAPGLVQQYQYQRAGTGIELQVNFDQGAVRRLVKQLGVPAVGARPPVLVLVRGPDGRALGSDALAPLVRSAGARGYDVVAADPARLPDVARLAAADPAALAQVDRQYHTGLILLGTLAGGGADWTLVSGGQAQQWTAPAGSRDDLLAATGGAVADRLGSQLNVIGTGTSEGTFWVGNVDSALAYADLLAMLRANPLVRQVQTQGAQNDGFLFSIKASVPPATLAASLAAGGRVIQDASPHAGADASLRWLH